MWGCADEGAVEIALDFPGASRLSPDPARIASVTVVTTLAGGSPASQTQSVAPDSALSFGQIPAGVDVDLAVELRSATQRLVGFGRAQVKVAAGEETPISLAIRKPFVYLPGGDALAALDATIEGQFSGPEVVPSGGSAIAAAASRDGTELWVISDSGGTQTLSMIATATHQQSATAVIPISGIPVTSLALSVDGRFAVIGHGGDGGGISLVDLAAARGGDAATEFHELGDVGAVAIAPGPNGSPRAYALIDRARTPGCDDSALPSTVVWMPLADPSGGESFTYDGAIHDFAVTDAGDVAIVADACRNELRSISLLAPAGDAAADSFLAVDSASAVAIVGTRVWGAGSSPAAGNRSVIQLASRDLYDNDETHISLAPLEVSVLSLDIADSEPDGQREVEQRLGADTTALIDLSVLPGADQIAVVTSAIYHESEYYVLVNGFPRLFIPEMEVVTREYLLVDAATAAFVQRLRTSCLITTFPPPDEDPVLRSWDCVVPPGAHETVVPFLPTAAVALLGSR